MAAPDTPSAPPPAGRPAVEGGLFERVARALEAAEAGSRVLDLMLANLFGDRIRSFDSMVGMLQSEGYSWDRIVELLGQDVPRYTASLDAALPGERIVFIFYRSSLDRWTALHRDEDGRETMAVARKEAMARRLARLMSLAPSGTPASASPEAAATAKDWTFHF
jgi:ABC-type multidrug transport system fused ATPase/permease subunit